MKESQAAIHIEPVSEEARIVTAYASLARIASGGGGAVGSGIRRGSVGIYAKQYFEARGRLPSGRHRVPIPFPNCKGSFDARFPERELADAAVLAIAGPRSGLHELLGTRLLGAMVLSLCADRLRRLEIRDDWVGLADPPAAQRRWSVARPGQLALKDARKAGALADAFPYWVRGFVELLRRLPLHKARYIPLVDHTDDYPSIAIRLELEDGEVTVGSQSQGRHRVPWYVDIRNRRYVANCAIPALALELARPWLESVAREAKRADGGDPDPEAWTA